MSRDLIYRRANGGRVAFACKVLEVLRRHCQVAAQAPEAGGVLLGRLIAGSSDVVVDEVTEPTTHDRRARFSFHRERKSAQQRVDVAWESSDGTRVYLGEWHSHPENRPVPSSRDLQDWSSVAVNARYDADALFFAILGVGELRVWELERGHGDPRELLGDEPTEAAGDVPYLDRSTKLTAKVLR